MIREVVTQSRTYRVEDDVSPSADALVVAQLTGGTHVTGHRSVTTSHPHAGVHIASGGWVVITGDPNIVCPDLATTAFTISIDLVGDSGVETATFIVPAGSALPFFGATITLTGTPIALAGLVRRRAFPRTPIPNASITAAGPHPMGQVLGLRSVVAASHAIGTPVHTRTAVLGAPHTITAAARSDATFLDLDAIGAIVSGSILALGDGEFGIVDAVDVAALRVRLRQPLQRTRFVGATIREATFGAPTSTSLLTRDALPGDGVIVCAGAITAATVDIDDPTPSRREIRSTGAVTDLNGRYRIAGVRDVDAISLTYAAAGFTTLGPLSHPLDPRRDPTVIDAELA